jgi:hypothetical protein
LSADPVALLVAEITAEVDRARMLAAESAGITDDGSTTVRRALGSILHDFYNCCERVFRKIAIEVNGGFDDSPQWHRSLLQRMASPLPGLRPAVLTQELAADLEEYLSFRHVFRSIHGFELKGERIGRLARMLPALAERFANEIRTFLRIIESERR